MARVESLIGPEVGAGASARPLNVADAWNTLGSVMVMMEECVISEAKHVSQAC